MHIRVLGPLEAFADGTDVTPTSPNQRTVLAVLAAHPDQHVRADTLIDALWGSDPPPTADRTLGATSPGSGRLWEAVSSPALSVHQRHPTRFHRV